jgi:hypothetical protein
MMNTKPVQTIIQTLLAANSPGVILGASSASANAGVNAHTMAKANPVTCFLLISILLVA